MADRLAKRPVTPAVAQIAIGYLESAREALPRLRDSGDSEGLHDFRVALRRLRSLLRSYWTYLSHGPSRKQMRRLRDLTRATNEARDLEVALAWLDHELPRLQGRRQQGGVRWRNHLNQQCQHAYRDLLEQLDEGFEQRTSALRKRLEQLANSNDKGPPFAAVSGDLLTAQSVLLGEQLHAISGAWDSATAHAARITGKRLRYLISPLKGLFPACRDAEQQLKRLQDLLGDLHDGHVRAEAIAARAAEVAAAAVWECSHRTALRSTSDSAAAVVPLLTTPATAMMGHPHKRPVAPDNETTLCDELGGLLAIADHNRERIEALWQQFQQLRREQGIAALLTQLDAAAAALNDGGGRRR